VTAVREALEALGHPAGALPQPRLLAALFVRFQAQVPLRAAPAERGGEACLAAWLEDGEGCCGERRVEAFGLLAAAAGFDLERALSRDPAGAERPVLLADRRRVLLDAGFPLPAPLLLDPPAEGEATGYGTLSVRPVGPGRSEVRLETRGDERGLFLVEVPGDGRDRVDRWGGPAPAARGDRGAGGPGLREPALFRLLDDRLLRWQGGVLEVADAWSRLHVPFPAGDVDGLEALFGPPVPRDETPVPGSRTGFVPTLSVYHASPEEPGRLLRLLAEPATHAALLPEGWAVEAQAPRPDGFAWRLVEDGALLRHETLTRLADGVAVEAEGPLALFRTRTWRLEPRPAGTRLRVVGTLRDPVPPRGLPEGSRRRLVFELASELLALDRLAGER
jgi:hypothetical protein